MVTFEKYPPRYPLGALLKELTGFFCKFDQKVPNIYLSHLLWVLLKSTQRFDHNIPGGYFSKNSQRIHKITQFYTELSKNTRSTHQVCCDQISGYFSKVITKYPLGDGWALLSRNHKELTKYPLGMWGSAPSVILTTFGHIFCAQRTKLSVYSNDSRY